MNLVSLALGLGIPTLIWLIVVDKLNRPRPFDYERDA